MLPACISAIIHYFKFIGQVFSVFHAESEAPCISLERKEILLLFFNYIDITQKKKIIFECPTIKFDKSGLAKSKFFLYSKHSYF